MKHIKNFDESFSWITLTYKKSTHEDLNTTQLDDYARNECFLLASGIAKHSQERVLAACSYGHLCCMLFRAVLRNMKGEFPK